MPGLHELKPAPGSRRATRRRGRGDAAGQGSYSGRGGKGQRKRGSVRPQFEGGQLPLVKRLPYLRGFHNRFRVAYVGVNLARLDDFEAGTEVTPDTLRTAGILRKWDERVKVLGGGEIGKALKVTAHRVSKSAREKIEAAGGSVTELDPRPEPKAEAQAVGEGKPARAEKPGEKAEAQVAGEGKPARAEKPGKKAEAQAAGEGKPARAEKPGKEASE